MRGRLLREAELDLLAAQPGLREFTDTLAQTDYGSDLTAVGGEPPGLARVERALERNLWRCLRNLRHAFEPDRSAPPSHARRLLGVYLSRHDLTNVVALVRAIVAGARPDDIQRALLPIGELAMDQLMELAGAPTPVALAERLVAWRVAWAPGLAVALQKLPPYPSLAEIELALGRAYTDWIAETLCSRDPNTTLLRDAVSLMTDVSNVLGVLRLGSRGTLPDASQVRALLLPGGNLHTEQLVALASRGGLPEALTVLGRSPLGRIIAAARQRSSLLNEVVVAEMAAERYMLRWASAQALRDPLGIGVAIAYHGEKLAEVRRLRLIARGYEARWPRPVLRELIAAA